MKTIYFVRHGETKSNLDGVLNGHTPDTELTDAGVQQAHDVATMLKSKPVKCIVSSPLKRAKQTASIIAEDVGFKGEVEINPLLTERDFGTASGKPKAIAFEMLDNDTAEGVESAQDLHKRTIKLLDWLKKQPEDHILIVGHAGAGQMLSTTLEGGNIEEFYKNAQHANGGIYEFKL